MPQAVSVSPIATEQPLDVPSAGNSIPGQRVNYNNFPDIAGDYTIGTLGASEQFAGADPTNINFKFPLRAYNNALIEFEGFTNADEALVNEALDLAYSYKNISST